MFSASSAVRAGDALVAGTAASGLSVVDVVTVGGTVLLLVQEYIIGLNVDSNAADSRTNRGGFVDVASRSINECQGDMAFVEVEVGKGRKAEVGGDSVEAGLCSLYIL